MIPKLFFQTFETEDLVPGMAAARATWLERNPGWEAVFHDAETRRSFIGEAFGPETVAAYDRLTSGAFKADLWRYCILHERGGVYADIDSVCLTPLDAALDADDRFVSVRSGGVAWAVHQGFIAAAPKHPFLARAIERATREVLAGETDGYLATGPGGLGIAINAVLGRPRETPFEAGRHDGYRLFAKDRLRVTDETGREILLTEYDGYRDDLTLAGVEHWQKTVSPPGLRQRIRRKLRALLGRD